MRPECCEESYPSGIKISGRDMGWARSAGRIDVEGGEAWLASVCLVMNGSHHVKLPPRSKPYHRVPVGPDVPSGVGLMVDDNRAQIQTAVVLQSSSHILVRRTECLVERRQGTGTVIEVDLMLPSPCAQVSAVGQQACEPWGIFSEAGTAMNGDPAGHSVLGAA